MANKYKYWGEAENMEQVRRKSMTDGVKLRIIYQNKPSPTAIPVHTTLEDLYLFHFADELNNDNSYHARGISKQTQNGGLKYCISNRRLPFHTYLAVYDSVGTAHPA